MKKKIENQPWWPKLVAQKDKKSLRELSGEFGVSPAAISNAFKRNNLKRKPARSGPRKYRTSAPAPKRRPAKKPATKRAAPAKRAPVAKKAAPAKRVSVRKRTSAPSKTRVKSRATKAPARRAAMAPRKRRISVLAKYQDQMGKVVDREIAEKAGVTVSAVTNYRNRHNIPPATGRGRPRRSSSAPAAPRASNRRRIGAQAYGVEIGGDTVVVVASNIVEAAQRASAAGRGEVTKIKLIGPAMT